jgi:nucleoside-diphosphate-sugar epimerase
MIVVTGGLGFIGTALCVHLARSGTNVLCLDAEAAVDRLPDDVRSHVRVARTDLRTGVDRTLLTDIGHVDAIVHLAAFPDPAGRAATCRGAVAMLVGLLDLAREFRIDNFVHASSSAVYFGAGPGPFKEDLSLAVDSPSTVEAIKKLDEIVADHAARDTDFAVASVRIANVYGPGYRSMANPPSQYCHLAHGMIEASAISDWTDNPFSRSLDYVHIFDCASGLGALARAPELASGRYNLSAEHAASPADVARLVSELTGSDLPGTDGPQASPESHLVCSRMRSELGWSPDYSMRTGLVQYLGWLGEHEY